jgi:HEAT repeat protein
MYSRPDLVNGVPVPHESPVAELAVAIRRPGPKAWAAFAALSAKGCSESLRVLREATADADWTLRRSAVEALGRHFAVAPDEPAIVRAFADSNDYVVRTACRAAAEGGVVGAHDAVVGLLRHRDPAHRESAWCALESLWRPGDFETAWPQARCESVEAVRRHAACALYSNATRSDALVLVEHWVGDPVPRLRVWACRLVARFGAREGAETVRPLLTDRDGHVRKAARIALGSGDSAT